ncbi:Beta-lactamase-like protein [Lachnellula subtilissima]|uniref:Beta-lactamase-like protein n=1 Tax=Lachnellula subtilissima TaxID=602034 RepID=A0A8H8RUG1_9HELO|nr:Beta-lactamase-like protein [Lachnellula subtilissima]
MHFLLPLSSLIITVVLSPLSDAATPNCPLLGPVFPKPRNITTNSVMQAAFANFTSFLQGRDAAIEGQMNSYSLEVFSADDQDTSAFTWYHTATNLPSFNSTGVTEVDGDSVYRIGSLTKLFSMYTFLIEAGDYYWNAPITDFVSELQVIAANKSGNALTKVSWNDITIGALASHLAGLSSDTSVMGELTQSVPDNIELVYLGFPPLPEADIPTCGTWPECDRAQFFNVLQRFDPAFAPFGTAAYSNIAYQILSYALEAITGKSFEAMLDESIINRLGLQRTFYNAPYESIGIIPGTVKSTNWYYSLGEENPAGNMYASSSDIARIGRSILNYEILSGPQTRRWMKPDAFDADPRAGIGAPWGIRRIHMNDSFAQTYRIVDTYDKGGSISVWDTFLALIPDYDVGFILMIAGNNINDLEMQFLDAWGDIIIPALEATARDQAGTDYAGTYSAGASSGNSSASKLKERTPAAPPLGVSVAEDSINPTNKTLVNAVAALNATSAAVPHDSATLNSSLTIALDEKPGLGVTSWISNGTDMMLTVKQLMTNYTDPYWVNLSIRLYPTDLVVTSDGTRQQSFKAIFEDLASPLVEKTYSTACATWIGPTAYVYGSLALDQFFFTTYSNGTVTVDPRALRVTLEKEAPSSDKRSVRENHVL